MAQIVAIRVDGLAAFSRGLKELDSELPKQLRVVMKEAATLVADDARSKVPRRSGRAARSIKPRAGRTQASVIGGGDGVPYYKWLDFGGQIGRRSHKARGNRGKRPYLQYGRYIYPSYFKYLDSGDLQKILEDGLLKAMAQAGLEVD